jgi:small subunit ribosomal protein S6
MTVSTPTYDLVLMLDSDLEEASRAKIVADARVAIEAKGKLLRHDDWGSRALAYPIDRRTVAVYHLFQFHAETPELLSGLNRSLRITDGVLRFRIIKLKPGVPDPPDMRATTGSGAARGPAGASPSSAGGADAPGTDPSPSGGDSPASASGEQPTGADPGASAGGEQPAGADPAGAAASAGHASGGAPASASAGQASGSDPASASAGQASGSDPASVSGAGSPTVDPPAPGGDASSSAAAAQAEGSNLLEAREPV